MVVQLVSARADKSEVPTLWQNIKIGLISVFLFLLSTLFYLLFCPSYWERILLLLGENNTPRVPKEVYKTQTQQINSQFSNICDKLPSLEEDIQENICDLSGPPRKHKSWLQDGLLGKTLTKCWVRKGWKKSCLGVIISTHDINKIKESRQVASQMISSSTAAKGPKKKKKKNTIKKTPNLILGLSRVFLQSKHCTENILFHCLILSQCHTETEMYDEEELRVRCAKKELFLLF